MKKVLALLLTLCMIFSVSVCAFADELDIASAQLKPILIAPKVLPGAPISRAEAVKLLWDDNGNPYVNYFMQFKDLTEGSKMYEAIRWAKAEKIVSGIGNGNFGAENPVTKEQFVTMLYRYAQYKDLDVSVGQDTNILSYEDIFETSKYAMEAFQWACGAGVTSGTEEGYLYPKACLTKFDAENMLKNMNELVHEKTKEYKIGDYKFTLPATYELNDLAEVKAEPSCIAMLTDSQGKLPDLWIYEDECQGKNLKQHILNLDSVWDFKEISIYSENGKTLARTVYDENWYGQQLINENYYKIEKGTKVLGFDFAYSKADDAVLAHEYIVTIAEALGF